MKKSLLFLLFASAVLFCGFGSGDSAETVARKLYGSIRVVKDRRDADYSVRTVEDRRDADLSVCVVKDRADARYAGLWYYVKDRRDADYSVRFVKDRRDAGPR